MKKFTFASFLILLLVATVFGQTDGSVEELESLWFAGEFDQILAISDQRLERNSNDIVGLILKVEYESEFLLLDRIPETLDLILEHGEGVGGDQFEVEFNRFVKFVPFMKAALQLYPPEELAKDLGKVGRPGTRLSNILMLRALESDGIIQF